ncbi:hypothetical protein ABT084_06090 [Streptomyces sp. NPDC002138]|uniref:hypothetical protein n=1 Tax=Streptomyces sp. NPDC002138 TaxID=3154410 RepID=UPI003316F7D4
MCVLRLLRMRGPFALYVHASRGGRRGPLGREADPFVAVLDPETGKTLRQWADPVLAGSDVLPVGEQLVLSRPELAAYALP